MAHRHTIQTTSKGCKCWVVFLWTSKGVYISVWASKSMLPFHLHLSPQTLSFLQKHFSSQKGLALTLVRYVLKRERIVVGENSASFTFCVSNSNMVQESDSCGTTLSFKVNVLEEDVAKNGSFLPHPQIHSYLHILLISLLQCLASKRWQIQEVVSLKGIVYNVW